MEGILLRLSAKFWCPSGERAVELPPLDMSGVLAGLSGDDAADLNAGKPEGRL